ncbi:MAG TPA: hypothetical protein V6D26_17015 [Stenomitos sp.]
MVIEGMQAVPAFLNHISLGHDALQGASHLVSVDWHGLAQLKTNTDLFGQVVSAWNNFVKTGQAWALLIGIIIGYFIKSFTTF